MAEEIDVLVLTPAKEPDPKPLVRGVLGVEPLEGVRFGVLEGVRDGVFDEELFGVGV